MAIKSPSSSSSSLSHDFSYDVFISFRGTDTRYGFTGNLLKALSGKGIHTFIDNKELKRGDEITPSLCKCIEDSRIAIIVLSKDYASSSFCLDELVHIIHYFKENDRLVLPVFYDVDPSHVRHKNYSYGEALAKHEERFQNNTKNMERLLKWKKALNQAADLAGYHFNIGKEYECDFIEKIVTDISYKINHVPLHVAEHLVGLESRISEVNSLLDLGCNDGVCIIGILGTGGMGKTTLAQAVYNSIAKQFECKCFLHNVRENSDKHGLIYLQEQLLSKSIGFKEPFGHVNEGIPIIRRRLCQKKVLLILDDVNKLKQLQVLIGDPSSFGHGSRVIITTRDKHLLSSHGIKKIYEADGLNEEQALELLRTKAFKSNKNDSRYDYILNRAIKYSSGLPLALEVVGSNLFGKSIEECESTLDKYERIPHEDIQKILKVSFDTLDEEQRIVFLDIACFFNGCRRAEVDEILHGHYGHRIKSHLKVLADKSLIKISYLDEVTLHDLIEDMGKEIVRQESPNEPGERSRLWYHDDIVHVLQENTGTSKIEMVYMNFPPMKSVIEWNGNGFKKMTSLKTLIIENGHFSKRPNYLPSSLRVLRWKRCTSESLSSFVVNKKFQNMKVLTFDHSQYLTHIPNVSGLPNLENLSFENCCNLITIDSSIGYLNKLEILNAKECTKLKSFPPLQLASLRELELSFCKSLKSFPELLCEMKNIKVIVLSDTSLELPLSFQYLSELHCLRIDRGGMVRFPKSNDKIYSMVLSNVEDLILYKSNLSDECLPILLKCCVNVKNLNLTGNNFKILPECLSECHLLKILYLDDCKSLVEIRGIPPNLKELSAIRCESLSSSSRRMLLSQKLHETGGTYFRFPNGNEGIPDWFEHQSRGGTISFWFRKEIPCITFIIILPEENLAKAKVNYFVNGYEYTLPDETVTSEHTILFDLKGNLDEMDKTLFKNEWIQVEFKFTVGFDFSYTEYKPALGDDPDFGDTEYKPALGDDPDFGDTEYKPALGDDPDFSDMECYQLSADFIEILRSVQMGIHVWKEKTNTEEDVIFTNPYNRKRKSDEYLNASLTQFEPPLKKKRFVEVGVSETEILQQQCLALMSGMRNLVLAETKENEQHG